MRRRDDFERTVFNELMNDLRAEDRAAYDRLKTLQDEHKKEQRKDEQRVLNELIPEAFAAVWEAARRTAGMPGAVRHKSAYAWGQSWLACA